MSETTATPRAPEEAAAPPGAGPGTPTSVLINFCLADFARALLSGLITSYLMVVFIPQPTSSLPVLLPAAAVTFAVVRGVGSVIDAVVDPLIAYVSDRAGGASGRRIPFMRWAVVPWAVSTALLVLTPTGHASWVNTVWVSVFMLVNLVSSSVYLVPFYALQAELVTDTHRRVWFFTLNTLFYVVGSAVVFLSPIIKGALDGAGLSELDAWRATFALFSVIGFVFAAIPAFTVRERRWVRFEPAYVPLLSSFRATLRYPNFVVLLGAYLIMWVAFTLFNATLLYYVTMLIGAPESFATVVSGLAIVVGIASYWPINALARRFGKKPLMVGACLAYIVIYAAIFWYPVVLQVMGSTTFAVLIGLLIGFPISVTNILPAAAFADLTQYDTIKTGVNRAGMFFASRNFITSLGQSLVLFVTPALVALGSTTGQATVEGVRLTAGVAAVAIAVASVLYWRYDDRHVTATIDEYNASAQDRVDHSAA
ncbi:MFS transporter [Brooklawnia cerclae]|uniref:GPH family glycoside/pentoside/hexuronide:cation symporter n=1 Tax=Brooklawnia cerclae TaxID=349934 RepID=A0ABX0SFG6_9ACTN|nr:MFS transporter [Brooklawnia cerclae]NIH57138.1 GPH family glycoside/pentoside/hexuronide:cation symporter [Brooklawnia cerclae]